GLTHWCDRIAAGHYHPFHTEGLSQYRLLPVALDARQRSEGIMEERHTSGHCTSYFLAELRANLQAEDRIKALVLLSYFPTLDPALQQRALFELSRHTGDFGVTLLGHLLANLTPLGAITTAVRAELREKISAHSAHLLTLLACPDFKDKTIFIELAAELQM